MIYIASVLHLFYDQHCNSANTFANHKALMYCRKEGMSVFPLLGLQWKEANQIWYKNGEAIP